MRGHDISSGLFNRHLIEALGLGLGLGLDNISAANANRTCYVIILQGVATRCNCYFIVWPGWNVQTLPSINKPETSIRCSLMFTKPPLNWFINLLF